jgi:biopolymer transport protein ExbD
MRLDARAKGRRLAHAEVNVTPVVDVMLVLLVIFMVTAPMLAAGLKVDLPKANAARPLDARDPVIVTLASDGRILIGAQAVTQDDFVAAVKSQLGDAAAGRVVRLNADGEVPYARVVATLDRLAAAGVTKIGVATQRARPLAPLAAAPAAGLAP